MPLVAPASPAVRALPDHGLDSPSLKRAHPTRCVETIVAPRGLLARRPSASKAEIPGTRTGTDPTCIVRCRTNCYRSGGRARHLPRRRLSCRAVGCCPRGRCRRRRRSQSGELHRLERARGTRRASQPASTQRTAARSRRPGRFGACCALGSRRPAGAPADLRHARSRTRRVTRPPDASGDRCASRDVHSDWPATIRHRALTAC